MKALVRFGQRLSRDASIYSLGSAITLVISLISVAVLTRFLDPAEFGEFAILLFFAALLTVLYNLGLLQGSLMWVFGSAGEEEADTEPTEEARDKRRALGVAFVATLVVACVGTAMLVAASSEVAPLIGVGDGGLVMIAATSGALGAVWRLVSNVPRLERRPGLFIALSAVRPVLVLGAAVPLVVSGGGVRGAISGVAIGTAAACGVGLITIRRSLRLAFSIADARRITALGAPIVPIIMAFWIIQNADLYALSLFAANDEVGLYRLASRVGSIVSYFVSAFLMAWAPLRRTSVFAAAVSELGAVGVGSRLITYYVLAASSLVLLLVLGAGLLVRIAPPAYGGAATLIPLLGLGFAAYGGFVVLYRAARFPRRRRRYTLMAATAMVVFLIAAVVLIPPFGAHGAAIAPVVGFGVGATGLVLLSRRSAEPIPFETRKILGAVAVAGLCAGLAKGVGQLLGDWGFAAEVGAVALFPLLVVALGIVPVSHLNILLEIGRATLPGRRDARVAATQLARLGPQERGVLELLLLDRKKPAVVAATLSIPEEEVERAFLTGLAEVAGTRTPEDLAVARFLLSAAPVAERDGAARLLWESGVDPNDLDLLEATLAHLRVVPREMWASTADGSDDSPA